MNLGTHQLHDGGRPIAAPATDAFRQPHPVAARPTALLLLLLIWSCAGHATESAPERAQPAASPVVRVGPSRTFQHIADAMRTVRDGGTVEVDAGTYAGDVGTWTQNNLTIRAPAGRATIVQQGSAAEGKALWVIKGNNVVVENFAFSGASVVDHNGAGIRHEGGRLTIRGCLFEHNQMGVLTWNDPRAELVIENSEFRDNRVTPTYRRGDPIGHQIYVGTIAHFTLRESYVHHGAFGHLVKSRARENQIVDNRITDEEGGRSSYELEFPNGGTALVIGNIIEQGAQTENPVMVSFGAEGYSATPNKLEMINNTLVDDLPGGGVYIRVRPGADRVTLVANLMIGDAQPAFDSGWRQAGNVRAAAADMPNVAQMDYRLVRHSPLTGQGVDPRSVDAGLPRLSREYVHPMRSRALGDGPRSPGALQGPAD